MNAEVRHRNAPRRAARALRHVAVRLLGVLVVTYGLHGDAHAQDDRTILLQAAFLHRFVGFVDWPDSERAGAFVLGVLGEDPFGDVLEAVFTDPHATGATTILRSASVDSLLHCGLVFVALTEPGEVGDALLTLRERPILLVGHQPGFAARGGHVNFYVEDERLRFEVNLDAVHASGLRMSSRLLALARIVREPGR